MTDPEKPRAPRKSGTKAKPGATTGPDKTAAKPAAKRKAPAAAKKGKPGANPAPARQAASSKPGTAARQSKRAIPESRWKTYIRLMRADRPIGTLLLLWPTLWALWLAAEGFPRWDVLLIFCLGVFLMRSAGCVINDVADRRIDGHVARTRERPLATGTVSTREALLLFAGLCLLAFILVLFTNRLMLLLSLGGVVLAVCYPFMKRHTHLPQVVLGAAFAWGIPMAFAAQLNALPQEAWLVYLAALVWTVVYDTFYAMVDRDDDLRIGVKSTAILFGDQDRLITAGLQMLTLYALVLVGERFELGTSYYLSLVTTGGLFAYQQYLIRYRERDACFKAFLNNNWVGLVIFVGIVASYF